MFDWGSQGGGFMANALGSNNLRQWGDAVQQPFTGMPTQTFWQPPIDQNTYGGGGQAQPIRPRVQMPQPMQAPTQPASFTGQAASAQQQPQAQPQPQPQMNTAQQAPPRGPFMAGQVIGGHMGNVDMLQKNKLAQPSGGGGYSFTSGGW